MQKIFNYKNIIIFLLIILPASLVFIKHLLFLVLIFSSIIILFSFLTVSLKTPYYLLLLVPIGSYMGYFIQIFKNSPIPFSLFQIFLLLFFVILLFNKIIQNNYTIKRTDFEIEFIIFFLLVFLSLIYSPNRSEGLFYAFRIIVLVIMFYLIVDCINNLKQINTILVFVTIFSVILALLSIKEGFMNPEKILWDYFSMGKKLVSRAMVNQKDPNIFASHFFLPIFFLSSLIFHRKIDIKRRAIGFIILLIILLGILSTFSRSAWIAVILGFLILVFFYKQYKMLLIMLILGLVILIKSPYSRIIVSNIVSRFFEIFAGKSDLSSAIRIKLGIGSLNMILDSFLLGVGFRGFPEVITRYYTVQQLDGVLEPHSVFYAIFAELGIVGFLIYCWIIFKIGNIAYHNFKSSNEPGEKIISSTLFVSFIAYTIFYEFYGGGLVDNNLWIIISLIVSFKILKENLIKE